MIKLLITTSDTNNPLSTIDLIFFPKFVLFLISSLSKSPVETLCRLKTLAILSACVHLPAPGRTKQYYIHLVIYQT